MIERIEELIRKIKYYDYEWYHKGIRIISDQHVEALRKELLELEQKYNYTRSDSPSINIGYLNETNRTIKHIPPMLSLNKTYNIEDIKKFYLKHEKYNVIAQPKLDGTAASVTYINNILDSISLRGNGHQGEDITHHINIIDNIAYNIDLDGLFYNKIIIRGEITSLDKKNRNIISGLLNRQSNLHMHKCLKFIPYDIVEPFFPNTVPVIGNIEVIQHFTVKSTDHIKDIIQYIKNNISNIDGVVFKIKDRNIYNQQGFTSRFPKGTLAFKLSSSGYDTKIIDIIWSIGRKHQLIPVACVDSVNIEGTLVKKVHLHNYNFLLEKDIGIGAIVKIQKTGNVVPTIVEIIKTSPVPKQDLCVFCNSITIFNKPHLYCSNNKCIKVEQEKILFFLTTIGVKFINKSYIYKTKLCLKEFIIFLNGDHQGDQFFLNMKHHFNLVKKQVTISTLLVALGLIEDRNKEDYKNIDWTTSIKELLKLLTTLNVSINIDTADIIKYFAKHIINKHQ